MTPRDRFPDAIVRELDAAKILGVRAGTTHRFTGVWVVVVEGRAFVRSWNDKESGWFRAFRTRPDGAVSLAGRDVRVRTKPVRSDRLRKAVTAAYAAKYPTAGSKRWVDGFAEAAREKNTLELLPR